MSEPKLIHGSGTTACPPGNFCLYRDVNFNQGSDSATNKILIIPEDQYIDDFAPYGFDYSNDGVSSVFNNTTKDNTLFSGPKQTGQMLPVAKQQAIADLTRYPLAGSSTGTWNDQVRSAQAGPHTGPLRIEQELAGHWQDWQTHKWIYSYDLTLHVSGSPVHDWSIGFGDLPAGTVLSPEFTKTFWGKVVEDGSNGRVLLETPDSGRVIKSGDTLVIRVQVLYPDENVVHEHLNSLNAQQLD
jgi:hypothetical protein